ncbi:hypothetical protein DAPPUDRAFT_107797 [Daphnia pulex]|uniref:Uncharacterized protein n=1 Tax=Daphnia pulex TaxID=6669 RepID=E9GY98_DAPPU|nr:hypothetical protein DAPPUDRAFT_107797 [Daphnia pulex]|eukprot:EFX75598.1 hypothetical protein DAPPUDRAFT_107797 [Daphnia pulex]
MKLRIPDEYEAQSFVQVWLDPEEPLIVKAYACPSTKISMKCLMILAVLVAAVAAAPQSCLVSDSMDFPTPLLPESRFRICSLWRSWYLLPSAAHRCRYSRRLYAAPGAIFVPYRSALEQVRARE